MQQSIIPNAQIIIKDCNWRIVSLPFNESVGHALKVRSFTQSIVCSVEDASGLIGFGEGAPRSYVTKELIEDVDLKFEQLLEECPIPKIESLDDIQGYTDTVRQGCNYPSLVCALESALLDLYGKKCNRNITDLLPTKIQSEPKYSMVLPFMTFSKARSYIDYSNALQVSDVKIKVGFDGDVDFVEQLMLHLSPKSRVRIDANRSWAFKEAIEKCNQFKAIGIDYIEEPLMTEAVHRLPDLSRLTSVKIGLDESLFTMEHAEFYKANLKAQSYYFNLKLSKCGGYFNTSRIWSFAKNNGIRCQLGCNVGETGILSALGRIFAQNHELLFLEGSFNNLLLKEDIVEEEIYFTTHGHAPKLELPGLGITVKTNQL